MCWKVEGGILNYFEQVGGAHDHGDCLVHDVLDAVNADCSRILGGFIGQGSGFPRMVCSFEPPSKILKTSRRLLNRRPVNAVEVLFSQ